MTRAATLTIDTSAIRHNLNYYRNLLLHDTKCMVVVKAFAYGVRSSEVALLLQQENVDYFAVAFAAEGIALRNAGITAPILVFCPQSEGFDIIIKHHLEPALYSVEQCEQFLTKLPQDKAPYPVQIKTDSGMHRLGVQKENMQEFAKLLKKHTHRIAVTAIYSHFTSSEDPADDLITHQQAALYDQQYEVLSNALGYAPMRHVLNSAGITRFPEYQADMVRIGIGLYGCDVTTIDNPNIRSALILKAPILQIKHLRQGETVSYNRRGKMQKDGRIATIAIGYADGFPRLAGNGRYSVYVNDQPALVIGTVCMDMIMVDVSHIPDVKPGDQAIIFGITPSIFALAQAAETIPYEIITNLSEQLKRQIA